MILEGDAKFYFIYFIFFFCDAKFEKKNDLRFGK